MSNNLQRALVEIFDRSQDSTAGHAKLINKCQILYKESDPQEFFNVFTAVIRNLMIIFQKNPHVDRSIDFIAKFASNPTARENLNTTAMDQTVVEPRTTRNMANNAATNETQQADQTTADSTVADRTDTMMEEEEEEFENEFLTALIDHLIETSKANSDAVRYRSCNILSKLMGAISNEQFIDEDLYDRLSDALLERLKDINSRVQVQAIAAIYRLQDPNDRDCRISRVFLFLMTYDPNWMVRYQALSHVAFSKMTLPDIIDRVRDPSANVRRKALIILSEKVLIKFITIEKRLFILNYSLNDEDPTVLDMCVKRLLPSWLAFKENDMVKLLKALDVVEATETMELMMDKIYCNHSLNTLCDEFAPHLNEKHVIPLEKLNAESVFYWSWICSVCKGKRTSFDVESEECLDRLLPSLTEFCEYTNQVIKHIQTVESDEAGDGETRKDERLHMENLFIIKQLIKMFEFLDFSDVHGKKTLINLCHDLFSNRRYVFFFDTVMSVYKLLIPSLQQRINNLTELISDIKDPHLKMAAEEVVNETVAIEEHEMSEACENSETVCEATPGNSTILSKMTPRELQLKISEAKYKRYQLKDSFDNLYKEIKNVDANVDLNKLSELRTQIKECEDEIALMEGYLKGDIQAKKNTSVHGNTLELVEADPSVEDKEANTQPKQDPTECILHCLNLAICLLKDTSIVQITPQLRSLFDSLIIPNIGSVNEEIRINAVRAMSLLCILKLEIAQKYVPLLLEMIQHDMKDVVIAAFQAMINCIMAFSMNRLANLDMADSSVLNNTGGAAPTPNPIDPQQIAERTAKILAVMTSLLDSEDPEIYTTAVEGFCKLYMTGHIVSAKLLSKLIIMYYSPITENDVKLRACLSAFLPQFSFLRPCNQVCVEETFMLILKSLINAPPDSYLSEIDLTKVMEVMFNLTNPKNLMQRRGANQRVIQHNNICHENIVRSICYEILKDENAYKCKTYLKIMNMADLSSADYLALKSIYELADEVQMHIVDKLIKKSATRFSESVMAFMSKKPEYEEEQRRKKEEEERSMNTQKEGTNETQILANGNETDATQMNSTRLSTATTTSNRLSMGADMIDLDFKKLGRGAKKANSNRTLSVTKIEDESNVVEADETAQVENRTVVENETVVETNKSVEENPDDKEPEKNNDKTTENLQSESPEKETNTRRSSPRKSLRASAPVEAQPATKLTRSKSKNNIEAPVPATKLSRSKSKNNVEASAPEPAPVATKLTRSKSKNNVTSNLMQEMTKNIRSKSAVASTTEDEDFSQTESPSSVPAPARKQTKKRSVAEKTNSNDEGDEEQNLSRTSRSQTRRSKEYEPPAKILRQKSTSKTNLKPPVEKSTRSASTKNVEADKSDKKETRSSSRQSTRQSTRSSSSK